MLLMNYVIYITFSRIKKNDKELKTRDIIVVRIDRKVGNDPKLIVLICFGQ